MLALCALTLSLVGLRSAAQPGPKVAVQYGFHDRWNGVHRLDGGVFPRSNSKELAVGHQKLTKSFDAGIGLEMAPAPQGVKSTSTNEVDKPWVDVDRADEAVEGAEKSTRSDAGAQNSLWINVNAVAAEPDHMDQVGEGGLSLVFGHLQPQGDAIHDW